MSELKLRPPEMKNPAPANEWGAPPEMPASVDQSENPPLQSAQEWGTRKTSSHTTFGSWYMGTASGSPS